AASRALLAAASPAVVGSKKFPESELLAEMASTLLEEKAHLVVDRKSGLGGTEICFAALQGGKLDVYPEYTGTALAVLLKEATGGSPAEALERARSGLLRRFDVDVLPPLGFSNTYALAMRRSRAAALGIATLSDLVSHAGSLVFGSSHEFLERGDGFRSLARFYGLPETKVVALEHGLAYQALLDGRIDVVDVYSTDGKIAALDLVVLADDRRFFPPYDAVFLVRGAFRRAHPDAVKALESLSGRIDDATIRGLNKMVEVDRRPAKSVAREFLAGAKLAAPTTGTGDEARGTSFLEVMKRRRKETVVLLLQHLEMCGLALALAVLVGVPIGIGIARSARLSGPVLGAAGVLQTIPGIALLALLIPIFGLGARPAIAALFLYALLPIVRNTFTGIVGVDADVVEAARGMGLFPSQVLRLVELPLALPTIMAGVRTSAVINVGTATLAAFVGGGGLGEPIVTGLSLADTNLILSGAVPAALLAVAVDGALGLVENRLKRG
ncbi:MAG TPA: glycine betaine ABC transporter substrate-binding protein, partial [Thermoanaerobaculia bacterium]|nr:glycine betaine ABC transporter substrate-binding protein [Thermoanaerobaculia bacterium]